MSRAREKWPLVAYQRAGPFTTGVTINEMAAHLGVEPRKAPKISRDGTARYHFAPLWVLAFAGPSGAVEGIELVRDSPFVGAWNGVVLQGPWSKLEQQLRSVGANVEVEDVYVDVAPGVSLSLTDRGSVETAAVELIRRR